MTGPNDDTAKDNRAVRDTIEDPESNSPVPGYVVDGELGRGGMGAVLSARRTSTGERVALKLLRDDKSDPSFCERFAREVSAAQRIPSPHVVRVIDYGISPIPFAAMEIVEGGSLREHMNAHKRVPLSIALRLTDDLLAGLGAAHGEGVIHRDIKPQNLLLALDGRLKIADFGVARVSDQTTLTQSGHVVGTPAYMSPEQARGERVGAGSDLFSAGIVLYEMLTGEHPFRGDDPASILHRILELRHRPASEVRPALPDAVDLFTERFLSAAERRFQGAAQARAALAPLLQRYGASRDDVAKYLADPRAGRERADGQLRGLEIRSAQRALVEQDRDLAMATTMRLLACWPADPDVRALAREVQAKTVMLRPSSAALALLRRAENEKHPIPTLREAVKQARADNDLHLERVAHARILQLQPDDQESGVRVRPHGLDYSGVRRFSEAAFRFFEIAPFMGRLGRSQAGRFIGTALAVMFLGSFFTCSYCVGFGRNSTEQRRLVEHGRQLREQGRCAEAVDAFASAIEIDGRSPYGADAKRELRARCTPR